MSAMVQITISQVYVCRKGDEDNVLNQFADHTSMFLDSLRSQGLSVALLGGKTEFSEPSPEVAEV